jgi:hypothetical protein
MSAITTADLFCLDEHAFGFATFQSHNQKVVSNRRGIFVAYLKRRNREDYTSQQWRLVRSTDGGESFETIHEATDATNPPVIESDEDDNVYLARPDFAEGSSYFYRFLAADDYALSSVTRMEGGGAGKYCMYYDSGRKQFYFFSHDGTFHVIGPDGEERWSRRILKPGSCANPQYPQLGMDAAGTLHAAWTGVKHGVYLYWDIRYMRSDDGGETWRTMDGTPVTTPVVSDEDGPADRISLEDEYDYHTSLASFTAKDGKLHFIYQFAAPGDAVRQHYVRYDLATARRDVDIYPEFRGEEISLCHFDGFLASGGREPGSPLYCVMAQEGRLACLASGDNGQTWNDYAMAEKAHALNDRSHNPYAIGGAREVTADGYIIGSLTDRVKIPGKVEDLTAPGATAPAYFFKIKAGLSRVEA